MKMKSKQFFRSTALLGLGLMLSSKLHAQTADWGTSYSLVGPLSYDSSGGVDNQVMTWTLGWFNDGYTPDATNWATWAQNWNPVDSNAHQNYPDPDFPNYWVTSGHVDDVGVAAAGRQMYTFAYNDLSLLGTDQGEALMFREDGALFPTTPNQVTFDIADNLSDSVDDNFTVIWGQVDRDMVNAGGLLVGGGEFSNQLPDTVEPLGSGTFEAQTATWPTPIPEPSAAILSCLGALALLRRRRPSK